MRARLLLVVAGASASVLACADLLGFKDLHEADAALPDVNVPDTGADVDTCQHARWPALPESGTPGTANAYSLALHHVYFTSTPDGGTGAFGFDLDNRCTTSDPATASCISPTQNVIQDGPGGVDNESIDLLNTLISVQSGLASALSDPAINQTISNGTFSVLFRIYGLQSDVNQTLGSGLQIAVQASPGLITAPPNWDGKDRWYPSGDDVVGGLDSGTNAPNRLISAYVNNGVLVATDTQPVTLNVYLPSSNSLFGPLRVVLNKPVLTAKLVKRSDGQYDMADGVIAGRWAAADMLRTIADLTINGQALCDYLSGGAYALVAQKICGTRDITANGTDNGSASCDGISVAVQFDAVAAEVSSVPQAFPKTTTPCADASLCAN